jgi:hypothetical protein
LSWAHIYLLSRCVLPIYGIRKCWNDVGSITPNNKSVKLYVSLKTESGTPWMVEW